MKIIQVSNLHYTFNDSFPALIILRSALFNDPSPPADGKEMRGSLLPSECGGHEVGIINNDRHSFVVIENVGHS